MGVLTGEDSEIARKRAEKLGLGDKAAAIFPLCEKHGITAQDTAYIGDDLNDLEALRTVAWDFVSTTRRAK